MLKVFCLGAFKVIPAGAGQVIGGDGSSKAWSVFKYLLAHRGAPVPTAEIMRTLWPGNQDSGDTSPLRTALSRLKASLEPASPSYSKGSYITYTKDFCIFHDEMPVWVDADEFEKVCGEAHLVGASDRRAGAELYLRALALYRGDYLAQDIYVDWTVAPRERYRRLFVDSSREAAAWLAAAGDLTCARSVLEHALQVEQFSEEMHVEYIQTLLKMGEHAAAAEHYAATTELLHRELGLRRSAEFRRLHRAIRDHREGQVHTPTHLEEALVSRKERQGPFRCDMDMFQGLVALERRRIERTGRDSSVLFLRLEVRDGARAGRLEGQALDALELVVGRILRKGDVLCRIDSGCLGVLLADTGRAGADTVCARVAQAFAAEADVPGISLEVTVRPLVPG
ncbi:MAG: hypothetical protein NUW23_15850 [Firmicutes bacterium]|jgi:DNA-binding SARP family transcriptional activator|nr:hypothetical protein [Bacillota bacterium]